MSSQMQLPAARREAQAGVHSASALWSQLTSEAQMRLNHLQKVANQILDQREQHWEPRDEDGQPPTVPSAITMNPKVRNILYVGLGLVVVGLVINSIHVTVNTSDTHRTVNAQVCH